MTNVEFFIILAPPLIGSLVMICRLHALKKHDRVLYSFCETRRHLMSFMREKNYDLRKQDYLALRQLQNWTDYAIHYYNDGKRSMFNARRVIEEIKLLKQVDKKIKRRIIQDAEVGKLYNEFGDALISGFLAFTPFLRSELVIRIMGLLAKIFAIMGVKYFQSNAKRIAESLSWFEEKHGLSYS